MSTPTPDAIKYLQANPNLAPEFESKYGVSSKKYLETGISAGETREPPPAAINYLKQNPSLAPEFEAKYKTPASSFLNIPATNDFLANVNKGLSTFNLAAGSVADPAIDAMTFGLTNSRQMAQQQALKAYPNIATDTGLLGQAYQLHQNPVLNLAGSALGAFGQTANIARALPQTMGRLARSVLPVAGYSVPSNVVSVAKGEQTPVQGLFNAGSDIALAPLGGSSRIKNALIQGAGGYGQGYLGAQFGGATPQQANEQALLQAALGLGMGAALHSPQNKQAIPQPKLKGQIVQRSYPMGQLGKNGEYTIPTGKKQILGKNFKGTGKVYRGTDVATWGEQIRGNRVLQNLPSPDNVTGLDPRKVLNQKIAAVDKAWQQVQILKQSPSPVTRKDALAREKELLREYDKLKTQSRIMKEQDKTQKQIESLEAYQARLKAAVDAKTQLSDAITKNKMDLENVKTEGKAKLENLRIQVQQGKLSVEEAKAQGRVITEEAKQATRRLETEGKILEQKAKQQTAETQGEQRRQTIESQGERRVKTAQELADIKKPKKAFTESDIEKIIQRATNRGFDWVDSSDKEMRAVLAEAIENDEAVLLRLQAEGGRGGIGGESLYANVEYKYDTPYMIGKNKSGDWFLKSISNEGQDRTRLFESTGHDSKILAVLRTKEPAPYLFRDGQVIDVESGEVIPKMATEGVKSSELKQKIQQVEQTLEKLRHKQVKVREVVEAAKKLTPDKYEELLAIEQEKSYKDSTEDPNSAIIEEATGDNPCV